MKASRRTLFALALAACVLLPTARALACACCSNAGAYYTGFNEPSAYEWASGACALRGDAPLPDEPPRESHGDGAPR